MRVEGLRQPLVAADLVHADAHAELLGQLGKHRVALREQLIARTLGGTDVDADAAEAHLQHHRQQIDLEPIGVARALLVEDGIEALAQRERVGGVGLGVWPDELRRHPPDMRLQRGASW